MSDMEKHIKGLVGCLLVLSVGLSMLHCRPDTPPEAPLDGKPGELLAEGFVA